MPDLGEQLSSLLRDPEAQKNITALLSSLGQSPPSGAPPVDLSALFQNPPPKSEMPDLDLSSVLRIQQIFSEMTCDSNSVNLLRALRPYLHEPQKADDAIRVLKLLSILPALKECGVFGGNLL